jgi:mannose-6-phosphate isomerase-like protein (cupin superfamily)
MSEPKATHVTAGTGPAFWGPGEKYTFLVTGEQTGGAYFVMEALIPPGGGAPPHTHQNEDETFYVVEGQCSIMIGDRTVLARVGDFVNIPRGTVHCFYNNGFRNARLVVTFTPAGIEDFFRETLNLALDRTARPPQNHEEVGELYIEAAPRYGLEFVTAARAAAA